MQDGLSNYHIVHLGVGDVDLMTQMMKVFGEAFGEPDTYDRARPSDTYLRELLSRESFIALAAIHEQSTVAALAAYVLDKFEQARSEIYIYDLAVEHAHRRRGLATALIGNLREIATQRGAHAIFVQADDGDEPAIALYSKLGRMEKVLHFDIDIASD